MAQHRQRLTRKTLSNLKAKIGDKKW